LGKFFKAIANFFKRPLVYWSIILITLAIVISVISWFFIGRWADSIVIAMAIVIIVGAGAILRFYVSIEREDRLQRGLDDPNAVIRAKADGEESVELAFQRAVQEIRGSRLGASGVDSLPWLLMLGESGEGKTAAVRESGLELPAEYATRVSGAPTASCDWWLTNDAIILDLAGRYLKCDDDGTEADWLSLLRLLRKQRPGCALNGIVFSMSVDSLLSKSAAEQDDVARSLRRRINEATDELGVDMPIYVMVTKLDHVEGFVECVSASPVFRPDQAMGWTNDQRVLADPAERVIEGLAPLVERLEGFLPELLLRDPDARHRRRMFAFPSELEQVIRAAGRFIGRAFAATPYDAPPFLRGVYFASARREGETVSPQLHRLGQSWARNHVDGSLTPGGLRLRDLFLEVIIGDRELALPMDRFGKQMRLAFNVAAGGLVALFAVWWLISFGSNFMGVRRLAQEAQAVVSGSSTLMALDNMRGVIDEESQDIRLLRRGGLAGAMETALGRARQTFTWGFGREYEVLTKRKLMSVVKGFDSGAFEALAQLATDVTYLATRGEGETAVAPDIARHAPISANASDVEAFRRGYRAFVEWSTHGDIQTRINQEREIVAGASARLLELKRLEAWAESSHSYPPARYADDGLPGSSNATTEVSGAYTRRAWEGLVVRLLEAIDSTGTASAKAKMFRDTYVRRYDAQWRQFLLDTPTPVNAHADAKGSPYLDHFERLHLNTQAQLPRRGESPPWILAVAEAHRDEPLASEISPSAAEGEKPKEPPPPPWKVYQADLGLVTADTEGVLGDVEAALGLATDMAERKGTNYEKAIKQVTTMVPSKADPEAAAKIEEILSMPILDSASAVINRASSGLGEQWVAKVVEPSQGRLTTSKLQQLYGPGGAVAELRSGALKPFYKNGRSTRIIGNRGMPFGGQYLGWMKSAERLQRVFRGGSLGSDGKLVVRLRGRPARITSGQRDMKVVEQVIRMRCDDGVQKYVYTSGSMKKSLKWSPDCDEVFLRVTVLENGRRRELTPVKEWKSPMALPLFLQDSKRSGSDRMWRLHYLEAGVTVEMRYELLEGDELLEMRHNAPPSSMNR
jgi:hypothetical protein